MSNKLGATAQEIADTYKARWQIELLFKWLKQHLQLKRFFRPQRQRGESANPVRDDCVSAAEAVPAKRPDGREPAPAVRTDCGQPV